MDDANLRETVPVSEEVLRMLMACDGDFLSFLEARLKSRQDAEDVLQDAFVKVMERGGELRRGESARAWFYRLLRRALVDRYRSQSALERAYEQIAELDLDKAALETALCRCLLPLVETLPEEQSSLLKNVEFEGSPLKDEAQKLGITANAAAARILRARKALFRELQRACRTCAVHGCLDCSC